MAVTKLDSNLWFWHVGNRGSNGAWQSEIFYNYSTFSHLCFLIVPNETDSNKGKLCLCEKTEDGLKKNYDLQISVKYEKISNGIRFFDRNAFSVNNIESSSCKNWNIYCVVEIRTDGLSGVMCKFLKWKLLNEISPVSKNGNQDVNYKQSEDIGNRIVPFEEDSSNEKESCSKSVKRKKLEEKIHGRETDLCRPRGDGDLGGDLRNAFLSVEDSDINLRVGDQNYPAHKVIIRNRSSVFRAMLEHDMSEKNKGIIDIEDCDPHIFKDFLLYLYSGKIDNISKENVFELYYMSDKYDVKLLKLDCVDYIINNFSTDVICDIIILAVKHNEQDMLKHATEFFIENAEDIFITVQWQKFMKENSTYANELILKAFRDRVKK